MLNFRMCRHFVFVDLLPCVICGVLLVMLPGVLVVTFYFGVHWMVSSCSEQLDFFCLCAVVRCFVNVVFPCVCVLSEDVHTAFYVCSVCRYCVTAD